MQLRPRPRPREHGGALGVVRPRVRPGDGAQGEDDREGDADEARPARRGDVGARRRGATLFLGAETNPAARTTSHGGTLSRKRESPGSLASAGHASDARARSAPGGPRFEAHAGRSERWYAGESAFDNLWKIRGPIFVLHALQHLTRR